MAPGSVFVDRRWVQGNPRNPRMNLVGCFSSPVPHAIFQLHHFLRFTNLSLAPQTVNLRAMVPPTYEDIVAAREFIAAYLPKTPLVRVAKISEELRCDYKNFGDTNERCLWQVR